MESKKNFYAKIKALYDNLQQANITPYVDTKNTGGVNLSYLSWGAAVDFFTKGCDQCGLGWNYSQKIIDLGILGYEVETSITLTDVDTGDELTRAMTLPAMDNANRSVKAESYKARTKTGEVLVGACDSFIINKTKQRCLVKTMTLFGLGLCLYMKSKSDLCDVETGQDVQEKQQARKIGELKNRIAALVAKMPADVQSSFAGYQSIDDEKELVGIGIRAKKAVDDANL